MRSPLVLAVTMLGTLACSGLDPGVRVPTHLERYLADHWDDPVTEVTIGPGSAPQVPILQEQLSRPGEEPKVYCSSSPELIVPRHDPWSMHYGLDQRCVRVDGTGPVRVISELQVEGIAQMAPGPSWDFSEVEVTTGRLQVVRAEAVTAHTWRRTVLSDHTLPAEPEAMCRRRPPLSDVPNDVAERCGMPEPGLFLVAVVMPDGTVGLASVHGQGDPAYVACAVQAARASRLPPTGCPPQPMLVAL
jgi:hypothetical protein